jgi:hypothetical protein
MLEDIPKWMDLIIAGDLGCPILIKPRKKHPELGRSHENQAAHVEYENLIKRILTILSLGYDGYDNS